MNLYDVIKTYILAPLVDLSMFDGYGESIFYHLFAFALAAVLVHAFLIVPYRLFLRLTGYKRWRK